MRDRTSTASGIANELRSQFDQAVDGQVTVLNTVIPLLKPYSEANGLGIPVHRHEVARSGPTFPQSQYHSKDEISMLSRQLRERYWRQII